MLLQVSCFFKVFCTKNAENDYFNWAGLPRELCMIAMNLLMVDKSIEQVIFQVTFFYSLSSLLRELGSLC